MLNPKGVVMKSNLIFVAMFFWMLIHHCLSPTVADNINSWDRAVLVEALVARLVIDFTMLLNSVINERDFKNSTAYPFSCMILQLCKNTGVSLWKCDILFSPTRIVDIGLITDEANVAAPWHGPELILQPLSENLADTVELDQRDDPPNS